MARLGDFLTSYLTPIPGPLPPRDLTGDLVETVQRNRAMDLEKARLAEQKRQFDIATAADQAKEQRQAQYQQGLLAQQQREEEGRNARGYFAAGEARAAEERKTASRKAELAAAAAAARQKDTDSLLREWGKARAEGDNEATKILAAEMQRRPGFEVLAPEEAKPRETEQGAATLDLAKPAGKVQPGATSKKALRLGELSVTGGPVSLKPEEPRRKGYIIKVDGQQVWEEDPDQLKGMQADKIRETFAPMVEQARDPGEMRAAQIGMNTALGRLGAVSLQDAIKAGNDAYKFERERERFIKPKGGGGGAVAPKGKLSMKELGMLGGANDDLRALYNDFKRSNNYPQLEQTETAAVLAQQLMGQSTGVADAVVLGQIIKSTEGGRATDADREVYLKGQGALSRLRQSFNYYTSTGKEPIMTPQFRADLASVAKMTQSATENKRKKLGSEFDKVARSNLGIKTRYPNEEIFDADVKSLRRGIEQQTGTEPSGKGQNNSAVDELRRKFKAR